MRSSPQSPHGKGSLQERWSPASSTGHPSRKPREHGRISVHAVYRQVLVEGKYDPNTRTVTIESAPWNGEEFAKPSAAAIAVVTHYNPERNANTNGWRFWRVSDTGRLLDSLRDT